MDYAYHSDMVEQDNKKKELEEGAFATISNLKFCNFRTPGFNKRKFPVNFLMLKEMCEVGGVLEDAHIFKYLFGFEVAGNCFKKQDEGFDFYEYDIRFDQWDLLLKFLKFGDCKLVNGEPENLMKVCNKFGGIPAYDRWYQNINQHKKKVEDENYNPLTPQEDTKQLYLWRACPDNRMEWFGNNNKGYSIAGHHKLGQITYTYYCIFLQYIVFCLSSWTSWSTGFFSGFARYYGITLRKFPKISVLLIYWEKHYQSFPLLVLQKTQIRLVFSLSRQQKNAIFQLLELLMDLPMRNFGLKAVEAPRFSLRLIFLSSQPNG